MPLAATDLLDFAGRHLGVLALLAALFVPAERLWPARPGRRSRRDLRIDLVHLIVNGVGVRWVALLVLAAMSALADAWIPEWVRVAHARQPWALRLVEVIVLAELCGYFAHRAMHRSEWLWRLHAVHHSSKRVDFLSSLRQHPLEALAFVLVQNVPPIVLGFPLSSVATFVLLQKLHTMLVHANVRLPLGPLRWVVAGPRFHHVHHAPGGGAVNLASLFPWMDRLFGTYREADEPRELSEGELA